MYLSFAAFIFAMSGCSNETFEEGYGRTGNDILVATIPSVESRTYMDGVSVKWSAGDKIGIFSQSNNSVSYANNEYTLSSEAGTQSAEFSGSCEGEKKVAYYPYSEDAAARSLPDEDPSFRECEQLSFSYSDFPFCRFRLRGA